MAAAIEITGDTATPALAELSGKLSPSRMAAAVGPACARVVQRHLRGLGRNAKGWPSTQFWARAAKATDWRGSEEGAIISINQIGVRQRYHGGTIKPVKARALTIPISPVSYGHVASDFPGLFKLVTKKGAYLVQQGDGAHGVTRPTSQVAKARARRAMGGNAARRLRAGLNFLFKLEQSVEQEGDEGVIPSPEELGAAAVTAIRENVES